MNSASSFGTFGSRVHSCAVLLSSLLLSLCAGSLRAQTPVVQINAGGAAVAPFVADTDFNTGNAFSSSNAISTSGVTNPAPAAVYQSVRWNSSFTYTIPNLTAGATYLVRLHFVELTWTAAGQRVFNVAINGTSVLANFDIFAQVGQNHALVKQFTATANSSGQIVIAFTAGAADNPSIAGIEVDTPATTSRSPYGGTNAAVSNGAVIQAENYDLGGEGVAYHDTDATNQGGQYRSDGVDIETTSDTGGGYDVGWINDGEWLDYTVNSTAGTYNIVIRGASNNNPNGGAVKVLLDGAVLGQVTIPYTGGWQAWQDFTISNVAIAAGTGRTLQLAFVGGGFNVNSVRFATSGGNTGNPNTPLVQINAGGGAVAPFVADTDFDTGNAFSSGSTIDTSGVTNAAPPAVYQSVRWNSSFAYTIGGLTANAAYVVRLHFVELTWTASGQRKFNVAINGSAVLSAFDVFAQVGQNHALEKEFAATANSAGQIVVAFSQGGADNPDVAGLEVWTPPQVPVAPSNLSAAAGNGRVSMTWTGSSGASSYSVYRGTTAGGESGSPMASNVGTTNYTDATVAPGTTYYYKVAAMNSAGTSGLSNEASAAALPLASAPTFSPAGGTYASAQSVTISDATAGATIHYTLDGSTPTGTTGNVYAGPVTIGSTTTLKAIASASGYTDSGVSSATYTIQGSTGTGDVVGKITVGYQGWFACIGDGSPINAWWHWSQNWAQAPSPTNNVLKGWPDMREYTRGYQTAYANLGNGAAATLYSDYDQQTTNTHFLWMHQNGCDTAALQRFNPNSSEGPIRDAVAAEVRTAAETYGVKFYIMYDATGWTNMATEMPADWTNKMSALTASPQYARQNGKPVVGIWGFGFNDSNHPWDAATCQNVITWFQGQGCYVMGGVPREWLNGTGGSRSGFLGVYHTFNMISPWMVGYIGTMADSDNAYSIYTVPDLADCRSHGIDYQPCVLPGDLSARQRIHGDLMWHEFYNMCRAGVQSIYISMFDEYGEGNQIAKTAENASMEPTNSGLLTLDEDGTPCSSDYYLRLTNDGGKMMKGQIPLTATRPTPTQ